MKRDESLAAPPFGGSAGRREGIGVRIHSARKERGISLRELGRRAQLTAGFLCDLEHGHRSVSVDNAASIARALGVSVASLVEDAAPADSIRSLATAARTIAKWLEWDREVIEDFHAYAHRFGGSPGGNVYEFVLREALSNRGLTLEQFRASNVADLDLSKDGK
jgi:transcriptional regulator with XRE-family HTH domain